MKRKLIIAVLPLVFAAAVTSCTRDGSYGAEDFGIITLESPVDFNENGVDDYRDLMLGARKDAKNKPVYDDRYWDEGYPPDSIGVCTDVVWRAFGNAGYSLRYMIDRDIRERPEAYPNITEPDDRIDFRRVVNLKVFFDEYAVSLTLDPNEISEWQAGDIVIFSDGKGKATHIGIISDKRDGNGVTYVIHNGGQDEREEKFLFNMPIIGHYRFDASLVDEDVIVEWEE